MKAIFAPLVVGGGCLTLIALWAFFIAMRTLFSSVLVWLGWTALVWTGVIVTPPTFWPVIGIAFCMALFIPDTSSSSND